MFAYYFAGNALGSGPFIKFKGSADLIRPGQ